MNDNERQIMLGGLLGNSYIVKGRKVPYLCIKHSMEHVEWLKTKALELNTYASKTPWFYYKNTCLWRCKSHPVFVELRELCYPKGVKEVSMEWLDQLRDIAIAVWYGDSGCLIGRGNKNACLRTQSFGLAGNEIIEKYFNEVGVPCNINKSRKSYNIVFTVPGTEILLQKLVAPWLPPNRYFKLI